MKKEGKSKKNIVAWIILVILILLLLALNYLKFFGSKNPNIENTPVDNSENQAVVVALQEIVDNFNKNSKIAEYKEQNITIQAVLNNYSIFISYTDDTTTTYEFNYHDFLIDITISNKEENRAKFDKVYEILIYAVQERLKNDENIEEYVKNYLNDSTEYDGLYKTADEGNLTYYMDITIKLKENVVEDTDNSKDEDDENTTNQTEIQTE